MTVARGLLVIVCGATGSGKTTLVRNAIADSKGKLEAVPKYSERQSRGPDDDVIHVERVDPGEYDMAYEAMGNRYGLKFAEIHGILDRGRHAVLSLTDIGAVLRLKAKFASGVVAVAVVSALDPNKFLAIHGERYPYCPDFEVQSKLRTSFDVLHSASRIGLWQDVYERTREIVKIWEESLPERASLEIRTRKVRDFQTRFFENFGLFDHTVLNFREGSPEGMTFQLGNILRWHEDNPDGRGKRSRPPLFVVSGSSGSGKGMMAEALQVVAPNEVQVVTKEAKRDPKPQDKVDGMIAIGPSAEFSLGFDQVFVSHKTDQFLGYEYAFSSSAVEAGLEAGIPQLLVANVLQNRRLYDQIVDRFGDHVVSVYLWRLQAQEVMESFQLENCASEDEARARIQGADQLYDAYQEHIGTVDHVLLNTAFPEDLHAQMFRLIDLYRSR